MSQASPAMIESNTDVVRQLYSTEPVLRFSENSAGRDFVVGDVHGMTDKAATGIGGGVGKAPQGPGWTTFYVQVKDIRASIARAEALGGKVLMPVMKIQEGEIAVVADPEGHPVGFATTE
jgi:predicted enzyme related to lactoylglutathione lyase